MIRLDEDVQAFGELRRKVFVEEDPQAASFCSNSAASRTSSGCTSNQRATISTDLFAARLRASTWVGTPDFATVGWPKLRTGSTTTARSLPSGHQRER